MSEANMIFPALFNPPVLELSVTEDSRPQGESFRRSYRSAQSFTSAARQESFTLGFTRGVTRMKHEAQAEFFILTTVDKKL